MRAEDLHDARQQALGIGTHVDGICRQPHRVRITEAVHAQAAHSLAAPASQVTVTIVGPSRSSLRMSGAEQVAPVLASRPARRRSRALAP